MIENRRSPHTISKKMGTSVAMLNNNYVQIDNDDMDNEEDEYHGI